jgi:hypothetical protein
MELRGGVKSWWEKFDRFWCSISAHSTSTPQSFETAGVLPGPAESGINQGPLGEAGCL